MKKVLVIEDDQDIAEVVEMALTDKYQVKLKTDNNNILDVFADFKPDIIMVDNQLGQVEAKTIMTEIKTNNTYRDIPFVLFSGHHDIKRIASEINAAAYLAKPFALIDLYSCIDNVFSKCA